MASFFKRLHFDCDQITKGADGSLILNLKVPAEFYNPEVPTEKNELIENFITAFVKERNPGVRSGCLKAIESVVSTNEAFAKCLLREEFCKGNITSKSENVMQIRISKMNTTKYPLRGYAPSPSGAVKLG